MTRLLMTLLLLLFFYTGLPQNPFRAYLKAAYDSSMIQKYAVAINLLYKAKALKGIDTGYNESVNFYLANNYESINKIDSSIFYYGEAIKYFESKHEFTSLAFLYERLGAAEVNYTLRYSKAIHYFKQQYYYINLVKDSSNLFDCINNIGIAYKSLGKYDSALTYFKRVSISNSSYNKSRNRTSLLIADTYSLLKRYSTALLYYDNAIKGFFEVNDTTDLFVAYINKSDCLMKQGLYKESLHNLKKAQSYLNTSITDNYKKELYRNLGYVYSKTGNFKEAYFYKDLENVLKDSINTASIEQAAAEMEAKYEVRKNQDSLLISNQKLILASEQSKERQRNFTIVLVVAIAISLLTILAFRNVVLRKQANQKLSLEKQKVEILAAELNESNQTKTKLFSIISHDLRSPISSLYALLKMHEIKAAGTPGADAVSDQVTSLLDTLEDLLIWSKSQMERFTLQPVMLNINDLYDELVNLYRDVAESKQITIHNKLNEAIKIRSDENLLKTILRNAIANAINHSAKGSMVVLDAVNTSEGITCSVSNEASKEDFDVFERKLNNASIESGAHGIGLVLMREFVQKLGATLSLSYNNNRIILTITTPSLLK